MPAAFPLALWLATSFTLGGDLGMSTDDYSLILRDPGTDALGHPFNPWINHPYFWRPLHIAMLHTVGTFLHQHWQLVHAACAAMHGLVVLAVFGILGGWLRSLRPALAAALILMVLPLNHEVIFWFSTLSASISTLLVLILLRIVVRWTAESRNLRCLWPLPLLSLAAACFYEQPAAGLAALPILYLAARPRGEPVARSLCRIAISTAAAGLGCVAYIAAMVLTTPIGARGGSSSFISLDQLNARTVQTASSLHRVLLGAKAHELFRGGVRIGWEQIRTGTLWVWIPAVLLTVPPFVMWWIAGSKARIRAADKSPRVNAALLILAGLTIFSASWLPVLLIRDQVVEMRTLYFPLIGLAISAAALLELLTRWLSSRPAAGVAVRASVLALLLATLGACGISLIGAQTMWQRRARIDQSELTQLVKLAPAPPPNAMLLPIELQATTAELGLPWFDRFRPGVFETDWSCRAAARRAYHRSDVRAVARQWWRPHGLRPVAGGLLLERGVKAELEPQTDGPDGTIVPLESLLPFVEGPKGQIKLVRELVFTRADGTSTSLSIPLVQSMLDHGQIRRGLTTAASIPLR